MAKHRRKKKFETPISRLVVQMVNERGGSAADFANGARLTAPQLSRVMNPSRYDAPPGILTCMKLAHASGFSAALVLRAAGHLEFATLIEQITGRAERPPDFTSLEQTVIRALRNMPMNERVSFVNLILSVGDTEQREPVTAAVYLAPRTATGD